MTAKRRRIASQRLTYGLIAILNMCVALMFVAILWPKPVMPVDAMYVPAPSIRQKVLPVRAPIIGTPTRIQVPSVGINSVVQAGDYDAQSKTWSINTSSAFYATATVPVNNTNGTTLIYGHAGWGIFENLPSVSDGAQALVDTSEGYTFMYTYESNRQVAPSDVSFLTSTGPPRLVLQTCSGAFDSYRTLVTFHLIGVRHA